MRSFHLLFFHPSMRKSRGSIKNTKKAFLLFRSFTFQDQILCFLESVFIYFFFLLVFQVFLDSFRYFFILQNEKRNSVFVLNCNLWKRWERNTGLHRRKCEEKSIFNEEEERNFFMRAQSSSCVSVSAWTRLKCVCAQFHFKYTKWPNVSRTAINESARCVLGIL